MRYWQQVRGLHAKQFEQRNYCCSLFCFCSCSWRDPDLPRGCWYYHRRIWRVPLNIMGGCLCCSSIWEALDENPLGHRRWGRDLRLRRDRSPGRFHAGEVGNVAVQRQWWVGCDVDCWCCFHCSCRNLPRRMSRRWQGWQDPPGRILIFDMWKRCKRHCARCSSVSHFQLCGPLRGASVASVVPQNGCTPEALWHLPTLSSLVRIQSYCWRFWTIVLWRVAIDVGGGILGNNKWSDQMIRCGCDGRSADCPRHFIRQLKTHVIEFTFGWKVYIMMFCYKWLHLSEKN